MCSRWKNINSALSFSKYWFQIIFYFTNHTGQGVGIFHHIFRKSESLWSEMNPTFTWVISPKSNLVMPGASRFDVACFLKSWNSKIPIIFYSYVMYRFIDFLYAIRLGTLWGQSNCPMPYSQRWPRESRIDCFSENTDAPYGEKFSLRCPPRPVCNNVIMQYCLFILQLFI